MDHQQNLNMDSELTKSLIPVKYPDYCTVTMQENVFVLRKYRLTYLRIKGCYVCNSNDLEKKYI